MGPSVRAEITHSTLLSSNVKKGMAVCMRHDTVIPTCGEGSVCVCVFAHEYVSGCPFMAVLPVEMGANVYLEPVLDHYTVISALTVHGKHPIIMPIPQETSQSGFPKVRFQMIGAGLDGEIPSE